MAENPGLREVGDRVEALLGELRNGAEPAVQRKATEIVRLLMTLYGGCLERIVELCAEDERADALAAKFTNDPLVASLLLLHGLHPDPLETRVRQALEGAAAKTGAVELISIEEGVVRVRLEGEGSGCGTANAKLAIEAAVLDAAPEVTHVLVTEPPARTFVQIQSLGSAGS